MHLFSEQQRLTRLMNAKESQLQPIPTNQNRNKDDIEEKFKRMKITTLNQFNHQASIEHKNKMNQNIIEIWKKPKPRLWLLSNRRCRMSKNSRKNCFLAKHLKDALHTRAKNAISENSNVKNARMNGNLYFLGQTSVKSVQNANRMSFRTNRCVLKKIRLKSEKKTKFIFILYFCTIKQQIKLREHRLSGNQIHHVLWSQETRILINICWSSYSIHQTKISIRYSFNFVMEIKKFKRFKLFVE